MSKFHKLFFKPIKPIAVKPISCISLRSVFGGGKGWLTVVKEVGEEMVKERDGRERVERQKSWDEFLCVGPSGHMSILCVEVQRCMPHKVVCVSPLFNIRYVNDK